jgi:protease I
MNLSGKRVMILVENMYNEFEYWYPYYRLKEAGAEVVVVGKAAGATYTSKYGIPAECDAAADGLDTEQFDGIVIPGGYAPDIMRRHPEMVNLVRQMDQQGKMVAAICHAGWMLASAGILKGRTVTSFFAIKDDLVNAGANWVDEAVVMDGNLITSRTPDDLPSFLQKIISCLSG